MKVRSVGSYLHGYVNMMVVTNVLEQALQGVQCSMVKWSMFSYFWNYFRVALLLRE